PRRRDPDGPPGRAPRLRPNGRCMMAQTLSDAFATVEAREGDRLDLVAGFAKPAVAHQEAEPAIAAALLKMGSREIRGQMAKLAPVTGVRFDDGEEAMQEAFVLTLTKDPDLFLEDEWMALLFARARINVFRMREAESPGLFSIEALAEKRASGDDPSGDDPFR